MTESKAPQWRGERGRTPRMFCSNVCCGLMSEPNFWLNVSNSEHLNNLTRP